MCSASAGFFEVPWFGFSVESFLSAAVRRGTGPDQRRVQFRCGGGAGFGSHDRTQSESVEAQRRAAARLPSAQTTSSMSAVGQSANAAAGTERMCVRSVALAIRSDGPHRPELRSGSRVCILASGLSL